MTLPEAEPKIAEQQSATAVHTMQEGERTLLMERIIQVSTSKGHGPSKLLGLAYLSVLDPPEKHSVLIQTTRETGCDGM